MFVRLKLKLKQSSNKCSMGGYCTPSSFLASSAHRLKMGAGQRQGRVMFLHIFLLGGLRTQTSAAALVRGPSKVIIYIRFYDSYNH